MVRTRVGDIRETGRVAQGVKLVDLDAGDKLKAIAPVISEEKEEGGEGGAAGSSPAEGAPEK